MTYNKKVIKFPSEGHWRFWDYVSPAGNNLIKEWVQGLSGEAQLFFNSILKNIRNTDRPQEWISFKGFLSGKYRKEKIWELEFISDKRQYRVLGVFGPGRKEATLLVGCYHKQRVYQPPNALDEAVKRKKGLSERRATRRERQVRDDF